MGIPENIDALLVKHDITQETLARIAGVSQSAVTRWRQGSIPRKDSVMRICDHFGIEWDDIMSDSTGLAAKEHRGYISAPNAIPVGSYEMSPVPLVGRVHAGPLTDPESLDERGETVDIPKFLKDADPDCYACESEGDCMNRVYPTGCIIVVSPNRQPQNGSVAVVDVEGLGTVMRRMYRTPNTLVLSPDSFNSEHKDIVITSEDDRQVVFGGKVVWYQPIEEME